ncbi:uncharacterized protein LOC111087221 [Limulus polyphemus]|uniref:Uncharacterized protein LOC111087221 n=1 Tax=Limulus polyphemus TaxID=6850 RepID=A0ABM1SZ00_LIMPO|nr:uncharacterized protein LOC111087221 [Limulus polyphemus]XP_022248856.1 uncharacterized protein LOC111087221 [Limulus polyphemus]
MALLTMQSNRVFRFWWALLTSFLSLYNTFVLADIDTTLYDSRKMPSDSFSHSELINFEGSGVQEYNYNGEDPSTSSGSFLDSWNMERLEQALATILAKFSSADSASKETSEHEVESSFIDLRNEDFIENQTKPVVISLEPPTQQSTVDSELTSFDQQNFSKDDDVGSSPGVYDFSESWPGIVSDYNRENGKTTDSVTTSTQTVDSSHQNINYTKIMYESTTVPNNIKEIALTPHDIHISSLSWEDLLSSSSFQPSTPLENLTVSTENLSVITTEKESDSVFHRVKNDYNLGLKTPDSSTEITRNSHTLWPGGQSFENKETTDYILQPVTKSITQAPTVTSSVYTSSNFKDSTQTSAAGSSLFYSLDTYLTDTSTEVTQLSQHDVIEASSSSPGPEHPVTTVKSISYSDSPTKMFLESALTVLLPLTTSSEEETSVRSKEILSSSIKEYHVDSSETTVQHPQFEKDVKNQPSYSVTPKILVTITETPYVFHTKPSDVIFLSTWKNNPVSHTTETQVKTETEEPTPLYTNLYVKPKSDLSFPFHKTLYPSKNIDGSQANEPVKVLQTSTGPPDTEKTIQLFKTSTDFPKPLATGHPAVLWEKHTLSPNENTQRTLSSSLQNIDKQLNDPPYGGPNIILPNIIETFQKPKVPREDTPEEPVTEPPIPFAEPGPAWKKAKITWGLAWDVHVYMMGSLFTLLAVYSFVSVLRLKTFVRLLSRGYFMSLNIMMFFMGVSRAVYLLYDPYNLQGKYPAVLAYFVFNSGYPFLTSAFSILFLALLQATKVELLSPKIQKPSILAGIIIFHFSFSLTTDILVGSFVKAGILLFVCQVMFCMWSLFLSVGYFHIFSKLYRAALRKQSEMIRVTFTKLHIDGAKLPKKLPRPTLGLAVKVTLVTAVFGLMMTALQLYGIIRVYSVFVKNKPEPWPWWAYQLGCRILELAMCLTMSFIATQPMRHFESSDGKCCNLLLWFPCNVFIGCCCKGEEMDYEAYSYYYANYQGIRNGAFNNASFDDPRRWEQGNSLPIIRTFSVEADDTVPLKSLPNRSRPNENRTNPSEICLLTSQKANHISCSTNDDLSNSLKTVVPLGTMSSASDSRLAGDKPPSMLYKEKGIIRFRREGDPEQPMEFTDQEDGSIEDLSNEDNESTKAYAGSSVHTLFVDNVESAPLSPFFQSGCHPRFKRMSRCSLETTDNSVNLSSEQLSNMASRNGLSGSALDFHLRKYGSTCSSESAANSFDVTFFLNPPSEEQNKIEHKLDENDENKDRVNGYDVMLRSFSPLAERIRQHQELPLTLNLSNRKGYRAVQVNVACGTDDITPDSAVYLDLQLSQNNNCEQENAPSVVVSNVKRAPFSHSMNDLTKSNANSPTSETNSKCKRSSRGFLNKLKGSTFSLNTNMNGYEPLESDECSPRRRMSSKGSRPEGKIRRVSSDRRPFSTSECYYGTNIEYKDDGSFGELHHVDSGLLRDSPDVILQIDEAAQTDPLEVQEGIMTICSEIGRLGRSQEILSPGVMYLTD